VRWQTELARHCAQDCDPSADSRTTILRITFPAVDADANGGGPPARSRWYSLRSDAYE
jgi:hypothetical protein